jgi:polyhydroxybutyrate depolymerase
LRLVVEGIIFATVWLALAMSGATAETIQLAVDGVARTYLLERPATQGPGQTIIMLHGATGGGTQVARATGLGEFAPQQGFVAVFPEGLGGRWNHLPPGKESAQFVRVFEPYGGAPDDVSFLKLLVADLVQRGISDPKRIFLSGESAGGIMALRMVCETAGLFTGIGLFIAAMPEPLGAACHPAKSLPVLMMNGTADQVLPYGGGPSAPPDRGFALGTFKVWPTERLVAFFRQLNTCAPTIETVLLDRDPHKVEIEQSTQCPGGSVVVYRIVGGGHAIPADLDVAQLLLNFFH